jgi:hypothetical protein
MGVAQWSGFSFLRSRAAHESIAIVNTRCLYHDLGFTQPGDNITMCPLLDFANHTTLQSTSVTQDEFALRDGKCQPGL